MDPLKNGIFYRKKRYVIYALITLIAIGLPFIKINGNHIFLLSFDHMELHLVGIVFNVQELYLMPFLLIILFVGIFFMTTIGGRIWCGWGCPQTIFRVIHRDLIETMILKLRRKISNKQQKPDFSIWSNDVKKLIGILLFSVIAFMASAVFLFYFVPPEDFFSYLASPLDHMVLLGFWLIIALVLIFDIVVLAENFCIYMCPYARVQSVLYDDDTIMAIYDEGRGGAVYAPQGEKIPLPPQKRDTQAECINCEKCVRVCPTHIDIRKGMQLECINCLECVDACTTVMGNLGKPSLISWSSPNAIKTKNKVRYFRFKTIGYIVVLALVFALLLIIGGKKEQMLLNIARTTELYEIRGMHAVDNDYVFLFQNTDKANHRYGFLIKDNPNIEIIRPKSDIPLSAGNKIKEVVILRAKKPLGDNADKDVTIPITIEAFATDEPDKIRIQRKTVFVYPRQDVLNRYQNTHQSQ
ncbi:cytochrome c oxidase accessory protein CcoG [Helicobacter sp. 12S02634-8]|uniref:cytochrome c oxidase accessory protein CcoG n=1 Tax=Helicobacter sp. 12S02634-8 TaxID=1476199 RepID=UPI000BA4FC0E|nr:cytochrome c oxidase accessory protein CcoG [Helicobacter sp. 12S02634-8]PAF47492.1 cytochrome c oxidase accessory protein CcoG [Helicobacter sp. 12S02634-8]